MSRVRIKEDTEDFKPFTLEIQVTTREDAVAIRNLFNLSVATMYETCNSGVRNELILPIE